MIKTLSFLETGIAITLADCLSLTPLLWLILCQYSLFCYHEYSSDQQRGGDESSLELQQDLTYIVYQVIRFSNNTALAFLEYRESGSIGDMATLLLINVVSICKRILEWRERRNSVQRLVCKMKNVKNIDEVEICLICRDSLLLQITSSDEKSKVQYEAVKALPDCCHIYHQQCLVDWLQCRLQCPACRSAVN